ncbi:MAG: DUF4836 family protein [Bacteroides sp.]|nr:DUF4836 family protein [Bacteroides sp.]
MKKNLFFHLLPVLALVLGVSACTTPLEKTEYTNVLPANTTEIAAINMKALAEKTGINDAGNQEAREKLLGLLAEGSSAELVKELKVIMKDPAEAGIDWEAPIYLFNAPSLRNAAMAVKVTDLQKFETLLGVFAKENWCTAPQKADGCRTVELKEGGIQLAYNNGTLLVVYGGSSAQLKKLQPAVTELMKQPADKSLHINTHFEQMMKQKGDIRLLATPDALPMDVRGVLNWPHGTQLLGYVLFENGRIYATLQRAGFEGKTRENNQPFHPKNARELQQAMMSIMRGTPFNIELTSEELLTLTNLRALMEFAPDQPEVNALYQVIMKIETLNVRGDNNRTTFTVVLTEKNQNALKQIIDFAKQFAGL